MLKQFIIWGFSSLLFLSVMTIPAATSAQEAGQTHVVEQGETLFSISQTYDVTVGDLRRWNQLEENELNVGQEINVGPPVSENTISHTVESGETLFAISRQYDVTIAELQSWNNLDDIQLSTGQELTIFLDDASSGNQSLPQSQPQDEEQERESIIRDRDGRQSTTYYTVRSGDTLTRIARQHNMSVDQLRDLNDLQSDIISVGQRLAVRDVQSAPSIAESAEESSPQGKFVTYRLERNESLNELEKKFRMSREELEALNPDINLASLSGGQRVTVLLPPSRNFENPYKKGASLENLGEVAVSVYDDSEKAQPTTSGELYNPDYLTAAHSNMPLGNVVYIENPTTGGGTFVRINDRISGSGIKLSQKAFNMLGFSSIQQARVVVFLDQ